MKNKVIFLFVFVPWHFLLTVILLQYYWFNYNPNVHTGLGAKFAHGLAFVLAVPVLTPFIVTDLGEYWPLAIQIFTFLFNSLVWSVVVLAVIAGIKHIRGKKGKSQTP
ncbi:MAG TPA: hypothetical protein HPP66_02195 [Planctomycetes bacterium]|nr:hypothetical protein [Planctomycetota bacterium]